MYCVWADGARAFNDHLALAPVCRLCGFRAYKSSPTTQRVYTNCCCDLPSSARAQRLYCYRYSPVALDRRFSSVSGRLLSNFRKTGVMPENEMSRRLLDRLGDSRSTRRTSIKRAAQSSPDGLAQRSRRFSVGVAQTSGRSVYTVYIIICI
jgi:hypothetical protein